MAMLMGADVGAVYTTLDEGNTPSLGDVFFSEGGAAYKFIVYSEEAAAVDGVAGEVAYYTSATGYQNSQVTSDLSASDELGAGVLQAALSDGEYGWVQIKGAATLTIAIAGATGDGDPLTPSGATDGTLDISAAVTDHVCAYATDESANQIVCDFLF